MVIRVSTIMIKSDEFKQILIDSLNLEDMSVDDIEDNEQLFGDEGLGLDSVDSIELVLVIEKEYGVKINNPEEYNNIFASVIDVDKQEPFKFIKLPLSQYKKKVRSYDGKISI